MRRDWVQNCTSIYMLSRENNIRYFTAINKKRMAEEKKLSQGLEKYTVLRRDHIHKKEEVSSAVKIWEVAFFLLTDKNTNSRYFVYNLSLILFWNPSVLLVSIQYNLKKIILISLLTDPYFNYRIGRGQPFYKADFSIFFIKKVVI